MAAGRAGAGALRLSELTKRALGLFERCLERDPAERGRFLDESAGGDEDLAAEVRRLLDVDSRDGAFLEPVAPPPAPGFDDPAPGTRVGDFRIRRRLATGGMGAVYEAEQEHPKRLVALKVMRPECVSAGALRRFRFESEILAGLRHPGIAQVYEAGVHVAGENGGRRELPFFAMELVEGATTITDHARRADLPLAGRLALFREVCDAVHFGHQKGVIHRDLKPGNILVDASGRPRVIDFGVARATGADLTLTTAETRAGQIIGTLQYVSPEQIDADPARIDTRTDVYSLGIVLYELVCGRLPYELEGRPLLEAARVIRDQQPRRPTEVLRALAGDLEAVLLKALAKEPELRYASVEALSADVGRYLGGEPIVARPPSLARQLRWFARRNRPAVVFGGALALLLVAATAVSATFAVDARRQRDDALAARQREAAALERVQGLFDRSLAMSLAFAETYMTRLHEDPGNTELGLAMVRETVENLEALLALAQGDAEVRARLAGAYLRLGDVQGNPFAPGGRDFAAAAASYERALEIARDLVDEDTEALGHRVLLGRCHGKLGDLAFARGDTAGFAAGYERMLSLLDEGEGLEGDAWTEHLPQVVVALDRLGMAAGVRGDHEAALATWRRMLALQERVVAADPDDAHQRMILGQNHARIAAVGYEVGDPEAAVAETELQIAELERALALSDGEINRQSWAECHWAYARYLLRAERVGDARAAGLEALRTAEELLAEDPDERGRYAFYGVLCYELAEVALADGSADGDTRTREALGWLARSLEVFETLEARGELLARESGHVARIRGRIEECERSLEDL